MNNTITVSISDMKITNNQDVLATYALGSCIGICLYDSYKKVGALGHIMLPTARNEEDAKYKKFRFANTCVPYMVTEMVKLGCNKRTIIAKIAGGATMFKLVNANRANPAGSTFNKIGAQNIEAVKSALVKEGIKIVDEDTGADYARTVFFDTSNGEVTVKSCNKIVKVL